MAAVITAVPVFALPTVLKYLKHCYDVTFDLESGLKIDKTNAASFLKLSNSENSALTFVLVGIIIMLVAEIAFIILKKIFCQDMDMIEMSKIVNGELMAVEEKKETPTAETEAPAEEPVQIEDIPAETEKETSVQD